MVIAPKKMPQEAKGGAPCDSESVPLAVNPSPNRFAEPSLWAAGLCRPLQYPLTPLALLITHGHGSSVRAGTD